MNETIKQLRACCLYYGINQNPEQSIGFNCISSIFLYRMTGIVYEKEARGRPITFSARNNQLNRFRMQVATSSGICRICTSSPKNNSQLVISVNASESSTWMYALKLAVV